MLVVSKHDLQRICGFFCFRRSAKPEASNGVPRGAGAGRMSRWTVSIVVAFFVAVPVPAGVPACADEFNGAMSSISGPDLLAHIEVLADDELEGRESGTRGGRAAADYLSKALAERALRPAGDGDSYMQAFERGAYRNLLAVLPGTDAELKHQYVLLGAHYDHVGYGTRRNSRGPWGRIHNGADDNASGVSGVLEVAEAVTLLDPPPSERGRDQGGITGRICASCLMGAKKFPREG